MGPHSAEMALARVLDQSGSCCATSEKPDPFMEEVDAERSRAGVEADASRRKKICGSIGLGQFLSALIATMSMSAASLDDRGVNLPSLLNCINYAVLVLVFFIPTVVSRGTLKLSLPAWRYALYSLIDVEANTLAVWAYRYTTITSVTMLDAFSIPTVMVLSLLYLGAKYNRRHLVGVVLCLGGLGLTVASDMSDGQSGGNTHPYAITGDVLCIIGAALYAGANVMQENFVKNHDRREFLGMAGLCGFVISGLQTLLLEREAIAEVEWTPTIVIFTAAYSLSLSGLYTWTSFFLQGGDAAMFNLSLLTSDVYALVFAFFVENATPNWLYFSAFGVIFFGIVLYHSQQVPTQAESRRLQLNNGSAGSWWMEDGQGGRWFVGQPRCWAASALSGADQPNYYFKARETSGSSDYYTTFGDLSLSEQAEVGTMPSTPNREYSC